MRWQASGSGRTNFKRVLSPFAPKATWSAARRSLLTAAVAALALFASSAFAAEKDPPPHPAVGSRLVPTEVDWEHPAYQTTFDDASVLKDWRLEGGKRMSIEQGKLVLESEPGQRDNHLVCWLTKEMPADFLLEFTVRPQNRREGLNIVFFSTRGARGGYALSRDPELIRVGDVYRVMEGPIAPMDCVSEDEADQTCPLIDGCQTRPVWLRVRDSIIDAIDTITLADLAQDRLKGAPRRLDPAAV